MWSGAVLSSQHPLVLGEPSESRYEIDRVEEDRRRQILSRLHNSALLAFIPIVLSAVVNVAAFTDRVDERLASIAFEGALCLGVIVLSRHPKALPHAVAIAVGFAIAVGTALLWGLSLSPRDLDVLVGCITALMIGTALLYPWGGIAQALVSGFLALGFSIIFPWHEYDAARAVNVVIPLALGVGLSVVGAAILERRRRAQMRLVRDLEEEGEISAALARVGHELISSLDRPVILERLCRLTTEVMDCDVSHTFLWREEEQAFVAQSSHGENEETVEILRFLRLPPHIFGDWLERLRTDAYAEFVRGKPGSPELFTQQTLYSVILHVALRRGDEVIGILTACRRDSGEGFSGQKIRIARGVAQLASMALENTRLMDEVEGANRLKTDFVATISHELRTPLGIIMGYADLLLEGEFGGLDSHQAGAVRAVERNSKQLFELITSILDLSRLEGGRLPVDLREVSVPLLIEEVCSEALDAQAKPEVQVVRSVAPDLPRIVTDVAKLKIVVKNLVVNALKFTEHGQVAIQARSEADEVRIDVVDTGIGMEEKALSIIFDPFRQIESCLTRSRGGLGLGLYIVKRLTHTLGGEISVESVSGEGSAFHLRLPVKAGQRLSEQAEEANARSSPRPGVTV